MEKFPESSQGQDKAKARKRALIPLFFGIATLGALIYLVATRYGQGQEFAQLLMHARPFWIVVAIVAQMGTYWSVAQAWNAAFKYVGHRFKSWILARLSLEKIFLDQVFPSAGIISNVAITRAFTNFGAPPQVSTATIVVGLIGYYAAFALMASLTVFQLWFFGDLKKWIIASLTLFVGIMILVPSTILGLVFRKKKEGPLIKLFRKIPSAERMAALLSSVSSSPVLNKKVLFLSAFWNVMEFALDAATLFFAFLSIGRHVSFTTALIAYVVASIAQTVGPIPGGIGTFEAACTATLRLLGIRVEPAITATLLLRGFSFWLPLIPGFILTRRDTRFLSGAGDYSHS